MILQLFRRTRDDPSIASLYGTIVAQARKPEFYQSFGVPDTVNGRLEMILLHVILLLRRLESAPSNASGALGQAIFDLFCQDMDGNLREMGVGDLSVPRTMRRIGEGFYGRQAAYRAALDSEDPDALNAALMRNILEGSGGAGKLARYVGAAVRALADQDIAEFRQGRLRFPDPAGIFASMEQP
ncbi:MAG TPA: ubiquinol-cytochrome C chaperone family protein [Hyphomicrobiaceae bacterium]|jgi:cytochrome b pre-mRNA-processing protein 3|nr:ubiquinol-cytochrome C chaperone family protein [Hyphomicrobiaceae bacterium]